MMDELIKKMWYVKMWYIHLLECYSAMKKDEILPFATTWMDLGGIMLSEISQMVKDKYHMISLICGIEKKSKTTVETK